MADTKRVMGVLPGKKDIRDYKFKKDVVMSVNYPVEYECPIKTNIKDQGSVGSCAAHSAAEILEYHYPNTRMSTNFIYGIHYKLYGTEGPGMYLRDALKIMKQYGDPEYAQCPGNTEVKIVYDVAEKAFADEEARENALEHRISAYAKVSTMNDIKYALVNYGPIYTAITWYSDNVVNRASGLLTKGTIRAGGHAIVIRGWTEAGWICQNSWGPMWGNRGCFILPFDYGIDEAYSIEVKDITSDDDIKKPSICDWLAKLINWIINIF